MGEIPPALLLWLDCYDGMSASAGEREGPLIPFLVCLRGRKNSFLLNFNWRELDAKVPGYRKARKRTEMIHAIDWEGKAHSMSHSSPKPMSHSPPKPLVRQRLNQTLQAMPLPPLFYFLNEKTENPKQSRDLPWPFPCSQWSLPRSTWGVNGLWITATRGPLIPGWSGWVASTPSPEIQSFTQQSVTFILNVNTGEGERNWVTSAL